MSGTLRTTSGLSAAILSSRVLGLLREVVFATLLGAGAVADAFWVAFRIPNLLRDLLAEGALSSAFVPTFTEALEKEGKDAAHHLGNLVMSGILVVTGVLTAAGMVFSEQIVFAISQGFGGDADKVALAASLSRIMMPILALVSLGAVWMGMLNAQRRFIVPALAPAIFNLVSIAGGVAVFTLGGGPTRGVLVWSIGTLSAGVVQAFFQLPTLWRMGFRPRLVLAGFTKHPGVRRIARLMAPAVLGVAAVQISVFINTGFAGRLGDGAVAQLTYAFRLFFLPLGMFGVALATVTTTSVSEAAARDDTDALASRAAESVRAGWMLVSASAVGLFILAEPIVALVYRHGATSASDAAAIAIVLQAYSLGLVPYALVKILAPAFYAVDRPRIPLLASVAGVLVNVTFNALTFKELGPPGIALGTVFGATVNVLILRFAFSRVVAKLPTSGRLRQLASLVLANALMGAAVFGGYGIARPWVVNTWVLAAVIFCLVVIGFVVFAGTLRVLGYPGAGELWGLPGRFVRKLRSFRP